MKKIALKIIALIFVMLVSVAMLAACSSKIEFISNGDGTCYISDLSSYHSDEFIIPSTSPDGLKVTGIGDEAIYGFYKIKSIVIPDGVTSIGNKAFHGCGKLESIIIPDSVTSIGHNVFNDCKSLKYNEYDNAYYLGNEANPYVVLIEAKNKEIASCNIHEDTKVIYHKAFENCSKLSSIEIPDSVMSISDSAFYKCSKLTSVIIGNSVTSIGDSAFYNCSSLEYNEYDNGYYLGNETNPYVVLIKAESKEITYFNIHANTKVIYSALWIINPTSIVIPNNVTNIENRVFDGCRNLTSIEYKGTKDEWEKISKEPDWNKNTGKYVIHCTDGDIQK